MSVVFESVIKFDRPTGEWSIELIDTVDNRRAICKDLDEYSQKIEEFGQDYGGNIDEVKWSKDENVPPFILDDVRMQMAKHQEEMEKKQEENN